MTGALPTAPLTDSTSVLADMRPAILKYFLRKTGNTTEAEDLTQDVLVRSLTHAHWKTTEEAKGYLFRSAINRWHDRQRKQHTQPPTVEWNEQEVEEYTGTESPPEHVLIVREEITQIFKALEGMNERTRAVLILTKVEQMKLDTVAQMLGISARAVNKHLAKGIEILIRQRKRQEWTR